MVSQRKRHVFLGLGLTVALVLAVGLLPAVASAASTLTGEFLDGSSTSGNSNACASPSYSVSGFAIAGPYIGTPSTFTESGSWNVPSNSFSATFTIHSDTTTITGSKTASATSLDCRTTGFLQFSPSDATYTATIHTPNGNFHDEGATNLFLVMEGTAPNASLTETFTSSLTQPVLIAPTSKDQCKNNGWKAFPQFKNQGECVSSVVSKPQT